MHFNSVPNSSGKRSLDESVGQDEKSQGENRPFKNQNKSVGDVDVETSSAPLVNNV